MGLVGACDIVVAGPRSTFALTEVKLGLAASIISLTVLPPASPSAPQAGTSSPGERFGSEEAVAIGLVTMETADPAATVHELLAELSECSPQGLAESKRLTTMRMLADFDRYGDELAAQSARLFGSDEAVEGGITAFLQRRPAAWSRM